MEKVRVVIVVQFSERVPVCRGRRPACVVLLTTMQAATVDSSHHLPWSPRRMCWSPPQCISTIPRLFHVTPFSPHAAKSWMPPVTVNPGSMLYSSSICQLQSTLLWANAVPTYGPSLIRAKFYTNEYMNHANFFENLRQLSKYLLIYGHSILFCDLLGLPCSQKRDNE